MWGQIATTLLRVPFTGPAAAAAAAALFDKFVSPVMNVSHNVTNTTSFSVEVLPTPILELQLVLYLDVFCAFKILVLSIFGGVSALATITAVLANSIATQPYIFLFSYSSLMAQCNQRRELAELAQDTLWGRVSPTLAP